MGAKKRRKKLNQNQLNKKIDADFKRKYTYIIPRENAIAFIPPIQNPLNRMFSHDAPLVKVDAEGRFSVEGNLGKLKVYYVPKEQHQQVIQLLHAAGIPESLHPDLTWAFLNMAFASCMATYSTNFQSEFDKNQTELFLSMGLLEAFANETKLLRGITFEYRDRLDGNDKAGRPNYGPLKSKKLKGHVAVQMVEKVLQHYQSIKDFHIFQSLYENHKTYGKADMFMGHKNAEKQSQSFYASSIFNYLRQHLFNGALAFFDDPKKYQAEINRLKALYPRKKLYLLIGQLMKLSGLLTIKERHEEEDIIETIEKKLTPLSKANKKHLQAIQENNRDPQNGMIEVTPFHELF